MIDTSKKHLVAKQQITNPIFQWPQIFPITITTYKSQVIYTTYIEEIRKAHTNSKDSTARVMIRNSFDKKKIQLKLSSVIHLIDCWY